jgi:hypothetical protein
MHAVLISFKTSDNRLGNEHYMTMLNRAMPYLGSISTLTRLSLTCRSLFDPLFLSSLATHWPALECLRLARPLKDDYDMKAYILYRYDFNSWEHVVNRLVTCLRNLKSLAYIAIDLSFADFRLMRSAHTNNAPPPRLPSHLPLPKSLQEPNSRSRSNQGSILDSDGDTVMGDATIAGDPLASGIAAMQVSGPTLVSSNSSAANLIPTSHNPSSLPMECAFCLRSFRAHSYYIEHEVAMGLGQGLPSLAAVRFRASFPQTGTGDSKENKWLIKRTMVVDPTRHGVEDELVQVWAPKWE